MCIDVLEIWFGIANGQILSELSAQMAGYYSLTFLFLDNLYVFVWLEHGCSRNMIFVSVSSNSFIKR